MLLKTVQCTIKWLNIKAYRKVKTKLNFDCCQRNGTVVFVHGNTCEEQWKSQKDKKEKRKFIPTLRESLNTLLQQYNHAVPLPTLPKPTFKRSACSTVWRGIKRNQLSSSKTFTLKQRVSQDALYCATQTQWS